MSIMQPPLALGQVVHDVVESLSSMPTEDRFKNPLLDVFEERWKRVSGEKGGFTSSDEEERFKSRGVDMIDRVAKNPGPLAQKAIKIRQDLPNFWLSEDDNIIVCGKIDWLSYNEADDTVTIIDFKTGKFDEDPDSLQLPLYLLLAKNCQTKPVAGASYWYLERDSEPVAVKLPDEKEAFAKVSEVARRIELARKLERFVCNRKDGCSACRPYEAVLRGEAKYIGVGDFNTDLYILQ
jgi:hypothetical protein